MIYLPNDSAKQQYISLAPSTVISLSNSEACNLLFQTWTRPVQMISLSLCMWLITITHLPGWRMVFVLLTKWVPDYMGLTVGLVVSCANACSKM